jgi:hypothetical protein
LAVETSVCIGFVFNTFIHRNRKTRSGGVEVEVIKTSVARMMLTFERNPIDLLLTVCDIGMAF